MPWAIPLLAPEVMALLVLGFEVVAVAAVLLILMATAKVWLEPLIASLQTKQGGRIARIADIPGAFIRGKAASALSRVEHSISVAATHRMQPLAHWFQAAGSLALGSAWALHSFASDLVVSVERLATVVLPREIRIATRPISRRAQRALAGAIAAGLAVRHLRRYLEHLYGHTIRPALRHLSHAVDVTIPRSLGRLGQRTRELERDLAHPKKAWLRRIAAAMWAAFLAGALVRTLARRFPWLFCRKVKNVGSRVCGMPDDLLGALLLETVLITGTVSVVTFARELQAVEHGFLELAGGFIDEADKFPKPG